MQRALANIFWLETNEIRSMLHDYALLGLLSYSSTLAIYAQSRGTMGELHSAALAIVDEDRPPWSRDITQAFLPPASKPSVLVSPTDVDRLLDPAVYTFVLGLPPHFARDVAAGRTPAVHMEIDATATMQAGIGGGYIQQSLAAQIARYASRSDEVPADPVRLAAHVAYNRNVSVSWFDGIMGIVNYMTMLAIILSGAAVVREREHPTMEHRLTTARRGL